MRPLCSVAPGWAIQGAVPTIRGPPSIQNMLSHDLYDFETCGTLAIASTRDQDFRMAEIYWNTQHWMHNLPMEDYQCLGTVATYKPIRLCLENVYGPMQQWGPRVYTDWVGCMRLLSGLDYRMAYVFANYDGCLDCYTRCPKDMPSNRYFLYRIRGVVDPIGWYKAPRSAWESRGYYDMAGWAEGPRATI